MTRFQRSFAFWFVFLFLCFVVVNLFWYRTSKVSDGLGLPFAYWTRYEEGVVRDNSYDFDQLALAADVVIAVVVSGVLGGGMAFLHKVQFPPTKNTLGTFKN